LDERGKLVIHRLKHPIRRVNRSLYEHFHLVRAYVHLTTDRGTSREDAAREVRDALEELRDLLGPECRFTVLIFPFLKPRA
jgi:hypothetical protein